MYYDLIKQNYFQKTSNAKKTIQIALNHYDFTFNIRRDLQVTVVIYELIKIR